MNRHKPHSLRRPLSKQARMPSSPKGSHAEVSVPGLSNGVGTRAAVSAGAVTVRVAPFPGVTEFGETPHVSNGVSPVTEHAKAIVPENPPSARKFSWSLAWPPCFKLKLGAAGLTVKSGGILNIAVTVWSEFSVTLHLDGSEPVQAPLQPAKVEFPDAAAVSDRELPGRYNCEQMPPIQFTEPSLLVTEPVPVPAIVTFSLTPSTMVAVTVLSESIVTEQPLLLGVPAHAPPQLCKSDPGSMLSPRFAVVPLR
jgi:hypothetical protein